MVLKENIFMKALEYDLTIYPMLESFNEYAKKYNCYIMLSWFRENNQLFDIPDYEVDIFTYLNSYIVTNKSDYIASQDELYCLGFYSPKTGFIYAGIEYMPSNPLFLNIKGSVIQQIKKTS